jgi:hypothetical protein
MAASLAVGGGLLLAMIVMSVRAAVMLSADARVPLHFGSAEHCYWASKRAGLVAWPVTGVVAFGVFGGVAGSGLAVGWVAGVRDAITPAVLVVLFGFQVGALILASHGAGNAAVPDGGAASRSGTPARSE